MTTPQYLQLGRSTALISFGIGTAIFGLYYLSSEAALLFLGYGYILLAGLVNIGILISILVKASNDTANRKALFTTAGLMLLNIPVMLFYCQMGLLLLNTMRITFINTTPSTITDIHILGCEKEYIQQLEAGQSKTVWINIPGDCAITADYLLEGQRKEETVEGYISGNLGEKTTHRIGSTKQQLQ